MSIRGLPDERPRPSVANLIGRFEQRASKRQSTVGPPGTSASPIASPTASRSTSVISHTTGDAALIDIKERREWPPTTHTLNNGQLKTTATAEKVPIAGSINFDELRKSLAKVDLGKAEAKRDEEVKSPQKDVPNDTPSLSASTESIAKDAPQLDVIAKSDPTPASEPENTGTSKSEEQKPEIIQAPGKITSSKSTPASTTSTSRSNATATRGTTQRTAAGKPKSDTSTPNKTTASSIKPLTAQRTGASTTSTPASRVGAKSPPSSMPRSKTPSALRPSTSGSAARTSMARSKTPTPSKTPSAVHALSVARPKTPSSGLYAPTKASLARARNAEAPPPPAAKKIVSPSSLERLMKPTAASASKVRTDPVSPPRAPPAKTARGAAPTRGVTVKPRIGLAGARMKTEREKKTKEAAKTQPSITTQPTSGDEGPLSSEPPHSGDEYVEQLSFATTESKGSVSAHSEHEDEHEQSQVASDIESYDDAFASDDDRKLDSAHIHSALPREEGELAPFAEPDVLAVPEHHQELPESASEASAEVELTETKDAVVEEDHVSKDGEKDEEKKEEVEEESVEVEVQPEAIANGAATPTPASISHNGPTSSPVPETEFDSVVGMLNLKPPRSVSPGEIPDEE